MNAIYACNSTRERHRGKVGTAVCFVLDSAFANHTIRTFLRDQGPGAVAHSISAEEAWRLMEVEHDAQSEAGSDVPLKGDDAVR